MLHNVLGSYYNGNYRVILFEDGTKIRINNEEKLIPAFAESIDLTITHRCDGGCEFCYQGCTASGLHADLLDCHFLDSLHPYTEVAIGGNDLTCPNLEEFLGKLKDRLVVANITVNQKHFMKNLDKLKDWQDRGLIHGLGVSLVNPTEEFIKAVKEFDNTVIHTIYGVTSAADYLKLYDRGLKILILGYKSKGRGVDYLSNKFSSVVEIQEEVKDLFPEIVNHFNAVAFDNLALDQIDVKSYLPEEEWDKVFMGDDGKYTFYIDAVLKTFAKDSLTAMDFPIGKMGMDEMFQTLQSVYKDKA